MDEAALRSIPRLSLGSSSPVAELMQELEPLMKQAKHKEAEALLDRALKLLNEPEKDKK